MAITLGAKPALRKVIDMAVLVVIRMTGDPDQLVPLLNEHLSPIMDEIAPRQGALWHSLAKTPDGVIVVDVWESADGLQNVLSQPEMQQAIERSGLPEPQIDVYELVDHRPVRASG